MANNSENSPAFYTSIAKAYDHIFPLKTPALEFTKQLVTKDKHLLDVGCATGLMAIALSPYCAKIDAFDLDADMIQTAKQKAKNKANIQFSTGDMLEMNTQYKSNNYDLVYCYGNTLVHLLSFEQISEFLKQAYLLLKSEGKIALQLLNYNHVLDKKITELPTIENENVKFVRKYEFSDNSRLIHFNTELTIKQTGKTIKNTAELFAIQPEELSKLMAENGFANIKMHSSFKKTAYNNEELPLIISAEKL